MATLVYLNGELVPKLEAKIRVYDHGLLFGDGVWEGMRLYHGEVFRLTEHVELLLAAARTFSLSLVTDDVIEAIRSAVAANSRRDGYVRAMVTRGPGTIGLDPRKCDPQLIVLVDDVVPFPAELYGHGLHIITATGVRLDPGNPLHRIRSLSHGHMVLAKSEALRAGCLDAVLLTTSKTVAGCTEGHIFVVKNGEMRTPPITCGFPLDVMRSAILEIAMVNEMPVAETDLAVADLYCADELFLAGTAAGVIGIVRLDDKPIGEEKEGTITRTVREAFRKLTRGK